jgi:translation initiation factor RLI1
MRDLRIVEPSPVPLEDLQFRREAIAMVDGDEAVAATRSRRGRWQSLHQDVGSIAVTVQETKIEQGDLLNLKIATNES